jgi:hypothetical protein
MNSALRFPHGRRGAVVVRAADERQPRTLFWLASFVLLSSVLAGLEIRSEALTLGSLPRSMERSGAAQPRFFVPLVAASVPVVGHDKD